MTVEEAVADEVAPDKKAGAGSWSILGFDYQVDVSVWLALDVMVSARMATEMTLEHVSEEDVEADIDELEPGTIAEAVPMHGYRLIVQAKRRTGNAWTEARYITLLKHGKRRKSALTRLNEDANARYLLITSAGLNDPVRKLGVRRAGSWPAADKVPANIAAVGPNIAGRLAIIGGEDDERVLSDIKALLLERFRVPRARWEDSLKALREAAWARMRGDGGGRWTRDDVEQVIAGHEGYLVTGAERDDYVKPTNWGDLTQALSNRNAIMIIGQSGSGKTATAEALWLDRKAAIPDLKRVHITHGPDQLRTDTTLPPVLYDIEDPWGRFKFEPDSRPWNDELAPALGNARHDRLFIATSRIDVAQSSGALDSVKRWRMPLDAENYGRAELRQLYRNLSRGLPPELAAFAHEREAAVLQQLSLPLELRKFFDALPALDRDELAKNPAGAAATAIEQAHRESIENTVVNQIEARDAVKPAAILWALIKPHGRLSIDVLRSLEDPLADEDSALEGSLDQLVSSFIVARNLRQGADGSLGYYHGKVEAGIEAALARNPQPTRRSFALLVNVLLDRDDDLGGTWGVETAAEIVRLSQRIPNAQPPLVRASQDRLDAWVEQKLASEGRTLDEAIKLAAAVGSPRSALAEMARWLEHRPDRTFPGITHWGPPEGVDGWYARMREDPAVRTLAEAFVRTILPTASTDFKASLASDLERIVGDVTLAFRDAALESAGYGHFINDDTIVTGALADLDEFAPVVVAAVAARQPNEAETERAARLNLAIVNDEVSEDYAEHHYDNDDGMTAATFLDAYVLRMRSERGWQSVATHAEKDDLRYHWLRELARGNGGAPGEEELEAAVTAGSGSDDEGLLWAVLTKNWDQRFVGLLLDRLVEGSPSEEIRRSALDALADHLPDRLEDVVAPLVAAGNNARLAQLALDLAHRSARRGHDAKDRHDAVATMSGALPEPFQALANAERAMLKKEEPAMDAVSAATLLAIGDAPEDVRAARLRLAEHLDFSAEDDVRWVLTHSEDHDHALSAIDVAIRRGMTAEIEGALDHKFSNVAARAIKAVSDPLQAPLPLTILARASRDSSPVRKAILAELTAKSHQAHLPTLILLSTDDWSRWSQQGSDDGNFPIARGAVDAIAALDTVPDSLLQTFIARAKVTEDLGLMRRLLSCAVKHGSAQRRAEVVTMSKKGKRIVVGSSAAAALLDNLERLEEATVALITVSMAATLPAMIADYHVWSIGFRGSDETVIALADRLAESDDRRIFLALLAGALRERAPQLAADVAARLPEGHPARAWAEGQDITIDRSMLIDLGDAASVNEAYFWMMKPDAQTA